MLYQDKRPIRIQGHCIHVYLSNTTSIKKYRQDEKLSLLLGILFFYINARKNTPGTNDFKQKMHQHLHWYIEKLANQNNLMTK